MLSLTDLKKYYVNMYKEIRNYLWDFNTVECLAELEISVYCRFPNMTEVRNKFKRLYECISDVCYRDKYLKDAVNDFKNTIYSSDNLYSRIIKPKEV